MDNSVNINACFDNSGFNSANSLTHLLDEDSSDITSIQLSEYVDVETFSKQFSAAKSKFSILSLNIQTINTKFQEFKIVIDQINEHHKISVICLQETHLDSDDPRLNYFEIYGKASKSCYFFFCFI